MRIIKFISLFLIAVLTVYSSNAQQTGTMIIEVGSMRNDNGVVAIAVFSGEEGFPGSDEKVLQSATAKIKDGKASLEFSDIPFGEYAISAYHDENANDDLDANWIGIPKEGVGASNNAKGKMGPPKYKDARFDFSKNGQQIKFDISYF